MRLEESTYQKRIEQLAARVQKAKSKPVKKKLQANLYSLRARMKKAGFAPADHPIPAPLAKKINHRQIDWRRVEELVAERIALAFDA